jgi:hypothetical protein
MEAVFESALTSSAYCSFNSANYDEKIVWKRTSWSESAAAGHSGKKTRRFTIVATE